MARERNIETEKSSGGQNAGSASTWLEEALSFTGPGGEF
jgi:hypothetical protein